MMSPPHYYFREPLNPAAILHFLTMHHCTIMCMYTLTVISHKLYKNRNIRYTIIYTGLPTKDETLKTLG